MARRRSSLLPAVAALALAGCAASGQPVRVNPDFQGAAMSGRTLHILPIVDVDLGALGGPFETAFRLQTRDSVYDPASVLAGFFAERLRPISDASPSVFPGFRPDTLAYRDTVLALPDLMIRPDGRIVAEGAPVPVRFRFPGQARLRKDGGEPDLGLQISHLRFEVEEKQEQDDATLLLTGGAGSMLVPKPKVLRMSGTFLLWDYRKDALVAFGWLESGSTYKFVMDRSDWSAVVREASETLVKHTPLKGKRWRARKEAGNAMPGSR